MFLNQLVILKYSLLENHDWLLCVIFYIVVVNKCYSEAPENCGVVVGWGWWWGGWLAKSFSS